MEPGSPTPQVPLVAEPMAPHNAVDLFQRRVRESAGTPCFRFKVGGEWKTATWLDWDAASREIAGGLRSLGIAPGDRVCLLASTRPEWMHCDIGILMAGAVTVPIYQSNVADECRHIIADSGARVVLAENPLQVRKLLEVRPRLGDVVKVVYFDAVNSGTDSGRGELGISEVAADEASRAWLISLDDLRAQGRAWLSAHADELEAEWARVQPDHPFTIVYTSGTTGQPKGAVLTHANIVFTCLAVRDILPFYAADEQLLFLPLAHIFAKILMWAAIDKGAKIAFAESIGAIVDNLAEIQPTFFGSVPRVYEKMYGRIQANRHESSPIKRRIFDWAVGVGREVSRRQLEGRPLPAWLRTERALAHRLVFSKIQSVLGGRVRFVISGGAPLAKEISEFFHAVGILVLEGYGLTETVAASFVSRPDRLRFGCVGPPIPGLEVKIAEDGEILLRGGSIMKGYFKQPEATAEVIDSQGWFHTGDIGNLEDGLLRITDRKKDIIVTAGGKNVAPQNLENALKASPFVSQAMIHGDRRPYLTALITLNREAIQKWADEHGLKAAADDLAKQEEVRNLIQQVIDGVNAAQPSFAMIKKFAILSEDFSQETGELTPTLKVKRKFASEKYRQVLDGLYPQHP